MKWLALLVGMFALPACADVHKLNLELVKQRHDNLCWAAVSAMASSAFKVPCQFRKPTQLDVVFSENVGTHELPRRCNAPQSCFARFQCKADEDGIMIPDPNPLANGESVCGPDGANCDVARTTHLLDLSSRKVADFGPGNVHELTAERIRHEIADRKAPVIIAWKYIETEDTSEAESRGSFRHFLIITGFDDATNELRIWDPWPAQGVELPEGHVRHKWLPYERYQNPLVDNGALVTAEHDADEFAFCRCDPTVLQSIVAGTSPVQPIGAQRTVSPTLFDFSHGVPELLEERKRVMRDRAVRKESGARIGGRLATDSGFATVVITTKNLLSESPERLLQAKTTSLVVPVLSRKKVVDSFMLINSGDGWQEGGYSNNEIARRLMQYRADRGSEGRFYLLSIADQGKVYLARGFGAAAELVPLDGNIRNEFASATRVLSQLAEQIRRQQGSQPDRPDQPERPES